MKLSLKPIVPAISDAHQRLRLLLWLLAVLDAATGALAAIAPHVFYRHVIGVDLLGPYNQHLLTDVGGFYLGFGLFFAWAAWTLHRELIRAACVAATLVGLLHFVYHAVHLEHFSTGDAVAQTTALAIAVVLPLVILFASRSTDLRQ